MSHITRHRVDSEYIEYLNSRYNDEPSEDTMEVAWKADLKKMKKLYKAIKDLIVVRGHNNNFCSDLCYYAPKQINYCRLFNKVTPNIKRCERCIEIFGKQK